MPSRRKVLVGAVAAGAVGLGGYAVLRPPSYEDAVRKTWAPQTVAVTAELASLVHFARLAASGHNTQPWRFSAAGNSLHVRPDLSRRTPVVDPDDHHLFASLGCAAENLILAAQAAGRPATIASAGQAGIEIALGADGAQPDPLFAAIPQRQCTRSDYDGSAVSPSDLALLEAAARVDGCKLLLLTDPARIESVLDLILTGNAAQVGDPAFVAELKHWLRFSTARAIETNDGLYAACSGNPTMPQWLGNLVFERVFAVGSENDKAARQVRSSSGLAVFACDRDDPAHWIAAGRSYQRFALQATALGLRTAFLNQPTEVAALRPELARLLNLGSARPDFVVRFGRGPAMPQSLRRPVADIIDIA